MNHRLLRLYHSIPLPSLRQGGTLSVRSTFPRKLRVKVIPQWRADGRSMGRVESHVSIHVGHQTTDASAEDVANEPGEPGEDCFRHVAESDTLASDKVNASSPLEHLTLTATVPEKVNLKCDLPNGGSISIENKIEGDVHLFTSDGNIEVKKIRGHKVDITALGPCNTIYASDVFEARWVRLSSPGRVRAKRIHGSHVDINVTEKEVDFDHPSDMPVQKTDIDDEGALVDISSLYISRDGDADLVVSTTRQEQCRRRAVRVKSNHGHVSVLAKTSGGNDDNTPVVELGGVNGSCDVSVHVSELDNSSTVRSAACQVHFDNLSPGSVSAVTADKGDMSISFDRKMEADVRLASSPNITSIDPRTSLVEDDTPEEIPKALKQLQNSLVDEPVSSFSDDSKILIQTNAFKKRHLGGSLGMIEYVEGKVQNTSLEPESRLDVKNRSAVGKIRLDGAAEQALSGFASSNASEENQGGAHRPLIVVATNGKIMVETLSWLGAIARRHGLDSDKGISGQ